MPRAYKKKQQKKISEQFRKKNFPEKEKLLFGYPILRYAPKNTSILTPKFFLNKNLI